MNGVRKADLQKRLNLVREEQNWLSFNLATTKISSTGMSKSFGEHDANNKLHGKGITIYSHGTICIGYNNSGSPAMGKHYINICNDGEFKVTEVFRQYESRMLRGTAYKVDGRSTDFVY